MSYTWGNTSKTDTILLDGCTKKVTRSAYEMLARQSSIFMPKMLWIDALCIDQDNEDEKAVQVNNMDQIYSSATLVTVFLGTSSLLPEHEPPRRSHFQYRYDGISSLFGDEGARLHYQDARLAINLLNEIKVLEKKLTYNNDDAIYGVYESLSRRHSKPQISRWEHLLVLLQHPWFARIWVVQEVALAKYVRIVYGDEVISWDRLASSIKTLQKNHHCGVWLECWHGIQLREQEIQHNSLYSINRIDQYRERLQACNDFSLEIMKVSRSISLLKSMTDPSNAVEVETCSRLKKEMHHTRKSVEDLEKFFQRDRVPPSLSELLADSFYFKATDPRDMIYGLMAICKDPLEIDYSIPLEKVYLGAAKALLEKEAIHLLLHASGIGNRSQINHMASLLPSWVPDWRSAPKYGRLLDHEKDGKLAEFTAGGTLPSNFRLVGDTTLALSGLHIDTVEQLWALSSEEDYQDPKLRFGDMIGLVTAYMKLVSELLGQLDNSDSYLHVSPPQSLLEAVRRVLVTDKKMVGK